MLIIRTSGFGYGAVDHIKYNWIPPVFPLYNKADVSVPEVLSCLSMEALKDKCISAVPLEFEHAVDVHVNSNVTANIRSENSETRSEP